LDKEAHEEVPEKQEVEDTLLVRKRQKSFSRYFTDNFLKLVVVFNQFVGALSRVLSLNHQLVGRSEIEIKSGKRSKRERNHAVHKTHD